jgi:hypothetical protein
MKKIYLLILGIVSFSISAFSQTEDVFRVNILNPAISYEKSLGQKSTLDVSAGIGYDSSYPNLTSDYISGFQYEIASFIDIQNRYYYNLTKRNSKGKNISQNSGDFLSMRLLYTGPRIEKWTSFDRKSIHNFAIGPNWGMQRAGKKLNVLFSAGPVYYFDVLGNSGFFPINLELNLGFNQKKK